MLEPYALIESWDRVRRALSWCKTTRNRFAHCHWLDDDGNGLFYTHIEKPAKSLRGDVDLKFFHVDAPLLERQEEHFAYVGFGLCYLRAETQLRRGKIQSHPFPVPGEKEAPPQHNPPEAHPIRSLSGHLDNGLFNET
jgi:hypothetical protein